MQSGVALRVFTFTIVSKAGSGRLIWRSRRIPVPFPFRAALAGRGDLSGNAKNSRGRNSAAMERSRHCTHYAVLAGDLFFGDLTRGSTRQPGHAANSAGRLVYQVSAYLCRCARGSASALLEAHGFSRLWSQRASAKTSSTLRECLTGPINTGPPCALSGSIGCTEASSSSGSKTNSSRPWKW
jgi:hypothetical protein